MKEKQYKHSGHRVWYLYGILAILCAMYHVLIWNSRAFCDWFVLHIYPAILRVYGGLTGLAPFSVGEWMIVLGVLLVVIWLVVWLVTIVTFMIQKMHQKPLSRFAFCRHYSRVFVWTLLIVIWVQSINCFTLYHTSTWEQTEYAGTTKEERDELLRDKETILKVWGTHVQNMNQLADAIPRDEQGRISEESTSMHMVDIREECVRMLQKLGDKYSRLQGYYPKPKGIFNSSFMSQNYTSGVFFPFSMEANYNQMMDITQMPFVICHELAHLKGYIQEDEANYIAYLACMQSDEELFRYSAELNMNDYLEPEIQNAYSNDYLQMELPSETSRLDNIFLSDEAWEEVEENAVLDTQTVAEVSDTMTETSLKLNGVEEGMQQYSLVVRLFLLEATSNAQNSNSPTATP